MTELRTAVDTQDGRDRRYSAHNFRITATVFAIAYRYDRAGVPHWFFRASWSLFHSAAFVKRGRFCWKSHSMPSPLSSHWGSAPQDCIRRTKVLNK